MRNAERRKTLFNSCHYCNIEYLHHHTSDYHDFMFNRHRPQEINDFDSIRRFNFTPAPGPLRTSVPLPTCGYCETALHGAAHRRTTPHSRLSNLRWHTLYFIQPVNVGVWVDFRLPSSGLSAYHFSCTWSELVSTINLLVFL